MFLFGHTVQSQVINFDVPGGAGSGAVNYSGQGAITDAGNTYWNPFVFEGTTVAGYYSDGRTPSPITLSDNSLGISFALSGGAQGTPGALEWPYAYGNNYATVTNKLNNVPAGTYDLYLFGKTADTPGYHSGGALFTVYAAGTNYGTQSTTNTYDSSYTLNNDYVVYSNVVVDADGVISFTYQGPLWRPDEGDFNGLQLVPINQLNTYADPPAGTASFPDFTEQVRLPGGSYSNLFTYAAHMYNANTATSDTLTGFGMFDCAGPVEMKITFNGGRFNLGPNLATRLRDYPNN